MNCNCMQCGADTVWLTASAAQWVQVVGLSGRAVSSSSQSDRPLDLTFSIIQT